MRILRFLLRILRLMTNPKANMDRYYKNGRYLK